MFYVYTLKSSVNGDIYVGFSSDLKSRLESHNMGRVKSTKTYKPWKLVYYEAYISESDARNRERQLKIHRAKQDLLKQIENSL